MAPNNASHHPPLDPQVTPPYRRSGPLSSSGILSCNSFWSIESTRNFCAPPPHPHHEPLHSPGTQRQDVSSLTRKTIPATPAWTPDMEAKPPWMPSLSHVGRWMSLVKTPANASWSRDGTPLRLQNHEQISGVCVKSLSLVYFTSEYRHTHIPSPLLSPAFSSLCSRIRVLTGLLFTFPLWCCISSHFWTKTMNIDCVIPGIVSSNFEWFCLFSDQYSLHFHF